MNPDIYENIATIPENVVSEASTTFKIDRIEYMDGIQIYIDGAPFPQKGLPTAESIWSINVIKKTIIEAIKLFATPQFCLSGAMFMILPKRKFMNKLVASFNRICWGVLNPHILKTEYKTPIAQELTDMISSFAEELGIDIEHCHKLGQIIAHVIEYDNAYRYRLEDLMSETSKGRLTKSPIKEIHRLCGLLQERDVNPIVKKNAKRLAWFLTLLLLSPRIRKSFKKVLTNCTFSKLQLDESDTYWCLIREDYNCMGMNYEDRQNTIAALGYKVPTIYNIVKN